MQCDGDSFEVGDDCTPSEAVTSSSEPPPPPSCPGTSCAVGEVGCAGNRPRVCATTENGCVGWIESEPCGGAGAVCEAGLCVFEEACPVDADSFCRDSMHVMHCENGAVDSYATCDLSLYCRENTASGRRFALCATDGDTCASNANESAECRGDAIVNCRFGLPVSVAECPNGTCVTKTTVFGSTEPSCG